MSNNNLLNLRDQLNKCISRHKANNKDMRCLQINIIELGDVKYIGKNAIYAEDIAKELESILSK